MVCCIYYHRNQQAHQATFMTECGLPTVILFGSTARGDNDAQSDIDILILEKDAFPKSIKEGALEIQKLSRHDAMRKAISGDLFMLHVVHEGKVISDPNGFFSPLRESFVIKDSYAKERREALLLASFIESNWMNFSNRNLLNKRIAWSVRTIVISQLIEEGKIIFSPKGLCESVQEVDISSLIGMRRSSDDPSIVMPALREFLLLRGGREFLDLDKREFAKEIKSLGKSVALSTFRNFLSGNAGFSY